MINLKNTVLNALEKGLEKSAMEFADEQIRQLDTEDYIWPSITKRSDGSEVVTPRDITDTGNLKDSLIVTKTSRFSYEYLYDADYAAIVHEGGVTSNGARYPDRPWIEDASKTMDLLRDIFGNFRNEL